MEETVAWELLTSLLGKTWEMWVEVKGIAEEATDIPMDTFTEVTHAP